jgi:flagellar hook protein FlgE
MGFQQGLSGLDAASAQLNVIGNNVANASTVGFKGSSVVFGDMYANSFYGVANTQPGIGVQTMDVEQGMGQGNITSTSNNLDLAINNNGFFVVKAGSGSGGAATSGTLEYTRNGQFEVDNAGYIVNGADRLQGWPATGGVINQGPVGDLQLQTSMIAPKVTSNIAMGVNLDSSDTPPTVTPLDPTNPKTYNWSNSSDAYDSLGNKHNLTLYYVENAPTAAGTTWTATAYVDGNPADTPNTYSLNFNTSGALTNTTPFAIAYTPAAVNGAASPMSFDVNYTGSTQYGQASATNALTNDGYASGTVSSMNISSSGVIQATYTNGQTNVIGQIALANFTDDQGLQSIGGNRWTQTNASGPAQLNAPGTGTAGTLTDSALESSNVDLTTELVNMITAQRFYQANSQTIKAEDTIQQTLVNLA